MTTQPALPELLREILDAGDELKAATDAACEAAGKGSGPVAVCGWPPSVGPSLERVDAAHVRFATAFDNARTALARKETTDHPALPELPEPNGYHGGFVDKPYYTADQCLAYGDAREAYARAALAPFQETNNGR